MKIKDTVSVTGDELYTHFAATGTHHAATTTNIHHGAKLYLSGLSLMLTGSIGFGPNEIVLDTFSTDATARNAMEAVQHALMRRHRIRHVTGVGKGVAKYVIAPLGLVLFGLAMNVAVHGSGAALQTGPYAPSPAPATIAPPTLAPAQMPGASIAQPNPKLQLAASSTSIASALKSGVEAGKFTIKLGTATGEPIYVFEDPLCIHCQELAPELKKLSKSHPVYVFPVSVIGGDDSKTAAATALCAADREKAWALAQSGGSAIDVKKPTAPSAECLNAVRANDLIFATIGMRFTPSLFNARGVLMPADEGASAEAIAKWLPAES